VCFNVLMIMVMSGIWLGARPSLRWFDFRVDRRHWTGGFGPGAHSGCRRDELGPRDLH
jgi:hypothetical protein